MNRTPTLSSLPFKPGEFCTICEALDYAAKGKSGVNFYSAKGDLEATHTYQELRDRAVALAGRLCSTTKAGDHIGLIADTSSDFVIAFYACQYAGVLPVPVSMPTALGGMNMYQDQLGKIAQTAKLHSLLAPSEVINTVEEVLQSTQVTTGLLSCDHLPETTSKLRPFQADQMCYIQFSSGSTSDPKGILGSQKSVTTNCRGIIQHGLEVREGDRVASWLPLYHDMGLIGFFIAPMMAQLSIDYLSPISFARRPSTWLKIISENKATLSYSPSFGYEIAAKRWRGGNLDLSSWRVAGIGGDMVRDDALNTFCTVFEDAGFSSKAFVPSYGLAETTLAVSFSPLNTGLKTDLINAHEMRLSQYAQPALSDTCQTETRRLVGCGSAMPDHEIRICDNDGKSLTERQVGRILIKGDSISPGVLDATQRVIPLTDENGWLDTGDLGYWLDRQLVITGRHKDLILWNGRNIWPQDIEWAAEKAGGKYVTRSAAFELNDNEEASNIYLLAECRSSDNEIKQQVSQEITATVRQIVGAPVSVVLVPTRSLFITSSGKLSRLRTRDKFISGSFDSVYAHQHA